MSTENFDKRGPRLGDIVFLGDQKARLVVAIEDGEAVVAYDLDAPVLLIPSSPSNHAAAPGGRENHSFAPALCGPEMFCRGRMRTHAAFVKNVDCLGCLGVLKPRVALDRLVYQGGNLWREKEN